ncbi:cysteine proteinase [Neoconidiobolus thromboides FSU 785]|nr:cysteine proteinase [Neoconidiobolus thromboides FSU 785]
MSKQTSFIDQGRAIEYFKKIGYYNDDDDEKSKPFPKCSYETLCEILSLQLKAIPFGALCFSYYNDSNSSVSESNNTNPAVHGNTNISTKIEDVFEKLIIKGREGYCFEQNNLLINILEFLGFECMLGTSKVIDIPLYLRTKQVDVGGFQHIVVIVSLEGKLYLLDAGFGPKGPSKPMDISYDGIVLNESGVQLRITETKVPEEGHIHHTFHPKAYVLEFRMQLNINDIEGVQFTPWGPLYYFSMTICYPNDIEVMNFYMCHHPHSLFIRHIVLSKFIDNGQVSLLDNRLRIYKNGKPELKVLLETEGQRRKAYKDYFSIELPENFNEHLPLDYGRDKL